MIREVLALVQRITPYIPEIVYLYLRDYKGDHMSWSVYRNYQIV